MLSWLSVKQARLLEGIAVNFRLPVFSDIIGSIHYHRQQVRWSGFVIPDQVWAGMTK